MYEVKLTADYGISSCYLEMRSVHFHQFYFIPGSVEIPSTEILKAKSKDNAQIKMMYSILGHFSPVLPVSKWVGSKYIIL